MSKSHASASISSFPRKRESSDLASLKPWRWQRLGDPSVTKIVMGQSPPSSTYNTERVGLPFYQGKADFGYINPTPRVWCSAPSRIGEAGDILMSVRAPVGDVNLTNSACAIGRGVAAIRATSESNSIFLYYALQYAKPQLVAASNGAIFESINKVALHGLEIPLPPKPEQQKIAAVLWKLQRAIATQDRLLAATADLKQSAMQRLFTHGLKGEPLKDTEIGQMPESWQVRILVDLAKLERGRFTHRPRNEPRFYGGNTPFVQTGDVVRSGGHIRTHTQSLNDEGVAISKVFPTGTILITIAANIGFTGILEFDSACPDSLIGITCSDDVDAEFLNYYLQTQQSDMDRLAPKGTQKNINIQFLQPWPVKVPELDEQRAIATALAALDKKLAHHRAKRTALHDLFETLLHKLMTAEIRVADLDIDTSEVADHFVDANKMVGQPATATGDQFVDANKMIRGEHKGRRH